MALRIICMCGYVIQGGDDELWTWWSRPARRWPTGC